MDVKDVKMNDFGREKAEKMRLIVGVSGASGIPAAVDVLNCLRAAGVETHLIVTRGACETIRLETGEEPERLKALADVVYEPEETGGAPASGTFRTMGMIVVPCSMKTLAGIHSGYCDNLLLRAADVTLKERRPLVLAVRECPFSTIHLRNMYELSQAGARICPLMLSFYNQPDSLRAAVRHMTGKLLDPFGLECEDFHRLSES